MEDTAYNLPKPSYREDLTLVDRGTPMGEYMRRFWHAIGLSGDATEVPRRVRALGEDLILFRDGEGRAGLVYPRCCHRGADLFFGRGEKEGIRCCYHGWLFDVEGRCVEMPMEPDGGAAACPKVRQPWYPVEERYGLIFAYMGPPGKKPLLPRYALLEELEEDEELQADDTNLGSGGWGVAPCNWLQHFENVVDPFHVPVLHQGFSGVQFVAPMGIKPEVSFSYFDQGVRVESFRTLEDGSRLRRVTECLLPNIRIVPSPYLTAGRAAGLGFVLPIDNTHFLIYVAARVKKGQRLGKLRSMPGGKPWTELTDAEHQRYPGDWETQVGQGPISYHSEENLVASDQGIAMLRRLLGKQAQIVAGGGDPVGWTQTAGEEWIASETGNFITASEAAAKGQE